MSKKAKGVLRYRSTADMPDGMRQLAEAQQSPAARDGWVPSKPGARAATHVRHVAGEMNKTEARYALYLDALKSAGEVLDWKFESIKLRLASRAWLTVDFVVWLADGTVELHEVKGRKGKRYFATEDGKLKIKFAAKEYSRWVVAIVWPGQGGGWCREVFPA